MLSNKTSCDFLTGDKSGEYAIIDVSIKNHAELCQLYLQAIDSVDRDTIQAFENATPLVFMPRMRAWKLSLL